MASLGFMGKTYIATSYLLTTSIYNYKFTHLNHNNSHTTITVTYTSPETTSHHVQNHARSR